MAKTESMIGGGEQVTMSGAERRKASGKKHIREMRILPAKNKGLTIEHHFASGPDQPYQEPESHVFSKDQFHSHVIPHIAKTLGMPKAAPAGEPDGDEGAPAGAAAAAAGGEEE